MNSKGGKNEWKSCSDTRGSVVPDPVWVLGEWEMSANRLSKLPQESLLQARHSCGPWDEGAQELALEKSLEKGRDVRMQSGLPPLADYESFKAGQLLSHTGRDAGINKSAQISTCLELHIN